MQRNKAALGGEGDGFGAVGGTELAHDGTDVEFGGALADDEVGGNLFVGHALSQQVENLQFTLGERLLWWHVVRVACSGGRSGSRSGEIGK